MTLDAAALLAGPRGRRLCLEYARLCAERARGRDESDDRPARDASDAATALWWAAFPLDPSPGTVLTFGTHRPGRDDIPHVTAGQAASALDRVDIASPTVEDLRSVLARSVDSARYWQAADGDDVLAATAEMGPSLARVAAVIAASPHARWWTTPVASDDQWAAPWRGGGTAHEVDAALCAWRESVAEEEARAARERPADPRANWTGVWWSCPAHALVHTTRSLPGAGPATLWFEEDSLGGDEAVVVPVEVHPARVIEIDGPDIWADLCRRHPLEVSASRRHDWFRTTGRDGPWVMPDWSRVAAEADGVHLTVEGYLVAAGVAIETGDGAASVIAGWNPDETYWFRGTMAHPAREQGWVRVDDVWRRAD